MKKLQFIGLFIDKSLKYINTVILIGIGVTLHMIYQKMPSTYTLKDVKEIHEMDREKNTTDIEQVRFYPSFLMNRNLIYGNVDVDNKVQVEVDNTVQVEIND